MNLKQAIKGLFQSEDQPEPHSQTLYVKLNRLAIKVYMHTHTHAHTIITLVATRVLCCITDRTQKRLYHGILKLHYALWD